MLDTTSFASDTRLEQALSGMIFQSVLESSKEPILDQIALPINRQHVREIKRSQLKSYNELCGQVDECERIVGQWQPEYKFSNIYTVIDFLQEQIEQFYYR
jgi:hypothetical protein